MGQYIVVYNQKSGQYELYPIAQGAEWDPVNWLAANGFIENADDYSVQTMEGQRPGEAISADKVADANAWVEERNAPVKQAEQQAQRRVEIKDTSAQESQTQRQAAGSNRGLYQQASGAPQQSLVRPSGGNLIAGLDPMGAPLTNSQIIGANQNTRQAAIDAGMSPTDEFDRQLTSPSVTMMNTQQMNDANKYTPGMHTNPQTPRPINDGGNGLGGPSYNPSNPSIAPQSGNQPYTLTNDDVALQSILNKNGTNSDLATHYINQGGYGNSLQADFAKENFEVYDDLWALQNPGAAAPDARGMYDNSAEYMNAMSQPVGDGIGMLNGGQLWDNQFSQEYMNSTRGTGTGENFDERSKSQYEQIMTNVVALQPSMGPSSVNAIANMIDKSYEDYRYLSMSGESTVQNMSFVQYLQSIGAEEWF